MEYVLCLKPKFMGNLIYRILLKSIHLTPVKSSIQKNMFQTIKKYYCSYEGYNFFIEKFKKDGYDK